MDERENVNLAAVKAIAHSAFPVEVIPGIRKNILKAGLLEYLLHYAEKGLITVHQHIEPTELEFKEKIGEGASGKVRFNSL